MASQTRKICHLWTRAHPHLLPHTHTHTHTLVPLWRDLARGVEGAHRAKLSRILAGCIVTRCRPQAAVCRTCCCLSSLAHRRWQRAHFKPSPPGTPPRSSMFPFSLCMCSLTLWPRYQGPSPPLQPPPCLAHRRRSLAACPHPQAPHPLPSRSRLYTHTCVCPHLSIWTPLAHRRCSRTSCPSSGRCWAGCRPPWCRARPARLP